MTRIPARLLPTQLGRWHVGPVRAGPTAHRPTGGALATPGLFTVGLGLLTVAWPLGWAPGWTYLLGGLGALAVLVEAVLRWPRGPVFAVTAGVVSCAVSTAGAPVLTAEGLFILCYLLAADAPPGRSAQWLRRQAVLPVAGLIAAGAVLAMDAVHLAASAWITVAGLTAAVAAYLIALPRRAQTPGPETPGPETPGPQVPGPQTSRSRDASSRPGSV
jgi:hypothetical protein